MMIFASVEYGQRYIPGLLSEIWPGNKLLSVRAHVCSLMHVLLGMTLSCMQIGYVTSCIGCMYAYCKPGVWLAVHDAAAFHTRPHAIVTYCIQPVFAF